jgi:hypothetical protein
MAPSDIENEIVENGLTIPAAALGDIIFSFSNSDLMRNAVTRYALPGVSDIV